MYLDCILKLLKAETLALFQINYISLEKRLRHQCFLRFPGDSYEQTGFENQLSKKENRLLFSWKMLYSLSLAAPECHIA